jgi:TetR/AcrR family transcriptional regulator, cholesterol catabolism regulator
VVAVNGNRDSRRVLDPPPLSSRLLAASERSQPARRLAAAALELFYQQGALATTVRDITTACGLTPGALYNHYESKNELLYVIILDIHVRLEVAVEGVSAGAGPDARDKLAAIVRHYIGSHAHNRQSVRVANREFVLLTGEWKDEVVAIRRRLREQVADVLWLGEQQGVLSLPGEGRAAASLTALAILDMCVHISEWFSEGRALTTEQLAERYVAIALRMAGAVPATAITAITPATASTAAVQRSG